VANRNDHHNALEALECQKRWSVRNVGVSETLECHKRWSVRNVGVSETLECEKEEELKLQHQASQSRDLVRGSDISQASLTSHINAALPLN